MSPVSGIPRLRIAGRGRRGSGARRVETRRKGQVFRYRTKSHRDLPHVVKFSGGRSSGLLLFTLLDNRLLDPARGDVIIFNNTSAEHPDTYRFASNCKSAADRYGVPFFWTEFQTYEDARNGEWTRLPAYRLVNEEPRTEANPDGFHWRGEVFEELLSWSGYVPNQFGRICTKKLKLLVTRLFLNDWLTSKATIPRLGHYGEDSRIDPEVMYRRHRRNGGSVPEEIFRKKRSFCLSRPHTRPEQRYEDYSAAWTPSSNQPEEGIGGEASFGARGDEYVALVGLRGDEQPRVQRVESRSRSPHAEDYKGEHVYMPLADMGVTRDDVNAFWGKQEWDLALPNEGSLSNCVFCFLKGVSNLRTVLIQMEPQKTGSVSGFGPLAGTPCDVEWWQRIERTYGRDLHAEHRTTNGKSPTDFIGFFGASNDFSYKRLAENRAGDAERYGDTLLPCDCTE